MLDTHDNQFVYVCAFQIENRRHIPTHRHVSVNIAFCLNVLSLNVVLYISNLKPLNAASYILFACSGPMKYTAFYRIQSTHSR